MLDGPSSATVNYGRRAEISCTSHVARRDEINNVEDIDFFLALVIIAKSCNEIIGVSRVVCRVTLPVVDVSS